MNNIVSPLVLNYINENKLGYIHSIFNNSLNIKFGDNLVNISIFNKGLSSFGLGLDKTKINDLILACKLGDIVITKKNKLIFYTSLGIKVIDIDKCNILDLNYKKIKFDINKMKDIYAVLKKINFSEKIGLKIEEVLYKKNLSIDVFQKFLAGRGKGLTPSGDDILMGYSLICNLFGENIKLKYGNITTDISKQYFKAFNENYVSEYFINLFKKDVLESIKNISSIGYTSGYDTLFGIYLGLEKKLNLEDI
ncbi:oxamate carbamoyltransferase subunit AllH family protein [Oceanivirga salmonicida]|uniref:oxamate carbamoyltransferase subunit AllH family protein n=1 Tax=Oceanivirga salmonicida TaxID=1769291 RepID=UPI0008324E7D|nr:DUF2877 domain-containing protein [Oceanivirga salmonicida]